jgi:replicative DNA helicase
MNDHIKRPPVVQEQHLRFLDDLRESGSINMYGATPYLRQCFDLDSKRADLIMLYWMDSFEERHPE